MIIVKLMGGLGNQMFQYAMGRRLSLLRNTSLKLDISLLGNKTPFATKRTYELNIFVVNPSASEKEVGKFNSVQKNNFKKNVQRVFPFIFPYYTIQESVHNYDENILNSPKNSLLIGYWQTEKYFLPIEKIIRQDFSFQKLESRRNVYLANKISNCESVSLHVRRGDYVKNAGANQFHGTCSTEYYIKSIELLRSKFPTMRLFIFSDDIEWVKENLKTEIPITFVDNNKGIDSYIDMQLMSLCKHNIIANSSFSWWGAWLNNNPDKKVIAPGKWFNNPEVNTKDVIPERWLKL